LTRSVFSDEKKPSIAEFHTGRAVRAAGDAELDKQTLERIALVLATWSQ
jgi:hypothetical protein